MASLKKLKKELKKYDFEKTYLDEQPELDSIVKSFIAELEPNYSEGYGLREDPEKIECRSRDGFIPHSHNHGGYDRTFQTDLHTFLSTGCGLCEGYDTETAEKQRQKAYESWSEGDMSDDAKKALKDIPKDKWNYHDLDELDLLWIAEELDEYESEWLSDSPIEFGYRAMYEGKQGAWHTLMIYCVASGDRYYGINRGDTIAEFDIKFRNEKELSEKLEKIKTDIESTF